MLITRPATDVAVLRGFLMAGWEMGFYHIAHGNAFTAGSQLTPAPRPVGFRWYESLNLALRLADVLTRLAQLEEGIGQT